MEVVVEDNGIGFDMEQAQRLFKPFHLLVSKRSYSGTGMGLAICRKIAERHGGSITAHSRKGEGATFVVSLPEDTEHFGQRKISAHNKELDNVDVPGG